MTFTIEMHCPNKKCRQRFTGECDGGIARSVCPACGGETIFRMKERRNEPLTIPAHLPTVSITTT